LGVSSNDLILLVAQGEFLSRHNQAHGFEAATVLTVQGFEYKFPLNSQKLLTLPPIKNGHDSDRNRGLKNHAIVKISRLLLPTLFGKLSKLIWRLTVSASKKTVGGERQVIEFSKN